MSNQPLDPVSRTRPVPEIQDPLPRHEHRGSHADSTDDLPGAPRPAFADDGHHQLDPAGHDGSAGHTHGESRRSARRRTLAVVLILTAGFLVIQVIGGLLTGSLALLADSGHLASDVVALGLALFASWYAGRPVTERRTYGFYRAEILAALANGVLLAVVVAWVWWEAAGRLRDPHPIAGGGMLLVAVAGLLVNLLGLWLLHRGGGESLNARGAFLHVLGDALGSVGAIIAALIVLFTGWVEADAIVSMVIGAIVIYSAYGLLKQALDVLMEAVPAHLNLADIQSELKGIAQVEHVHDLHVWTLTTGYVALSGHLVVADDTSLQGRRSILSEARHRLRDRFAIRHATIQIEAPDEETTRCVDDPRCL